MVKAKGKRETEKFGKGNEEKVKEKGNRKKDYRLWN